MTDLQSEPRAHPRSILRLPDLRLRQPSRPVNVPDPGVDRLARELFEAMRSARGVGLAAPQVGENVQVAVIEIESVLTILVNPVVEKVRDEQTDWEGCLSI